MDIAEVISVIVLLVAFVFMLLAAKQVPKWKYFFIAFLFPVVTGITTIAEDYLLHDLMNYIEHISWMIGAIAFCWATYKFEALKDRFYKLRGWNVNTGWPTRTKLEELGLKDVADELASIGRLP